ncbi:MAG: dihydropteroate synthase, partial [Streptosporangiaceae bacterium]
MAQRGPRDPRRQPHHRLRLTLRLRRRGRRRRGRAAPARRPADVLRGQPGSDRARPGLGFAKRAAHDWALLAHLGELRSIGFPLLVGASRKSFLGAILAGSGEPGPSPRARTLPPAGRDAASAAVSALAAAVMATLRWVRV